MINTRQTTRNFSNTQSEDSLDRRPANTTGRVTDARGVELVRLRPEQQSRIRRHLLR